MRRLLRNLALWTLILDGLLVATLLIDRLLGLIVLVYGSPVVALGIAAGGLVGVARGRKEGLPPVPGAVMAVAVPTAGWLACFAVAYANRITHM